MIPPGERTEGAPPGPPARRWVTEDVVLVRWPEQADVRDELSSRGQPRLLLVATGAEPPEVDACEEDWVRLPSDEGDLRARLEALSARAARHRPHPEVPGDGRLRQGRHWVVLSPLEDKLAGALVERFGEVVSGDRLVELGWPAGIPSGNALRVQLARLRRRLHPLGLQIRSVHGRGYVLEHAEQGQEAG